METLVVRAINTKIQGQKPFILPILSTVLHRNKIISGTKRSDADTPPPEEEGVEKVWIVSSQKKHSLLLSHNRIDV